VLESRDVHDFVLAGFPRIGFYRTKWLRRRHRLPYVAARLVETLGALRWPGAHSKTEWHLFLVGSDAIAFAEDVEFERPQVASAQFFRLHQLAPIHVRANHKLLENVVIHRKAVDVESIA